MKQRIVSGACLVLFVAAIVVFNHSFPLALNIVVALVSAAGVFELVKAMDLTRKWFLCGPALLAAAVIPFCNEETEFLAYCLFTLLVFSAMIVYHKETTFKEVGVLYSMVVLIPSALQCLVSLRDLSPDHGMFYVLIAVLAAWVADAGAYFAGTLFGKHKLCPEISPKKTVEGAIGGVLGTMVFGVIITLVYSVAANRMEAFTRTNIGVSMYVIIALLGCVAAVLGIYGDLFASVVKRQCGIKDYGTIFPGHGGILDRFDSVMFIAPFVTMVITAVFYY